MPEFCDVALPVPLDMAFTYRVPADATPVVGGRVLVPFRQQRLPGIVTELHDRKPKVQTKNVISVLDPTPVLDEQLLRLGQWIADYYLAPIGEVFRSMLPLNAEFKRQSVTASRRTGHAALHAAGQWDRPRGRAELPKSSWPNFACWNICSEEDRRNGPSRANLTSCHARVTGRAGRHGAQEVDRA